MSRVLFVQPKLGGQEGFVGGIGYRGRTEMTLPLELSGTVQSVVQSRKNGHLLAAAAVLWINDDDTVLDMTYGRGMFWTQYQPANLIAHDLIVDGVDFRSLPEPDGSVDVAVFDPPYIVMGGRDTSTAGAKEQAEAFGLLTAPTTVRGLEDLFCDGIVEAHRVLNPRGRLLIKCQDFVSSGGYVPMRHFVVATALGLGFVQVDEFVHYSGTGPQPSGRTQHHSRRAHSFLCVFRKGRTSTGHSYQPRFAGVEGNPIPPGCRLCDRGEGDHPTATL